MKSYLQLQVCVWSWNLTIHRWAKKLIFFWKKILSNIKGDNFFYGRFKFWPSSDFLKNKLLVFYLSKKKIVLFCEFELVFQEFCITISSTLNLDYWLLPIYNFMFFFIGQVERMDRIVPQSFMTQRIRHHIAKIIVVFVINITDNPVWTIIIVPNNDSLLWFLWI